MQGGMDKTKLRGINKFMINMLTKGLSSQTERTESDERMLYLVKSTYGFPRSLQALSCLRKTIKKEGNENEKDQ